MLSPTLFLTFILCILSVHNALISNNSFKELCGKKFQRCEISGKTARIDAENEASISFKAEKNTFSNNTGISARISGLQFLDVPEGGEMRIHDLRLDDEHLLFDGFSTLMGYLQPSNFPTELVKNALQNRIPFHLFTYQLLKMEIVVIGWIILWAVLALCFPLVIASYLCCTSPAVERLDDDYDGQKCTERTLGFLMQFLLLLLLAPIILILVGNEQISRQMRRSPETADLIFADLSTFVQNTHMQMSFIATSSTDIVMEAIRKDFDNLEELLGRPYKKQLETETGIDTALETLDELKSATGEVTALVANLIRECEMAREARDLLQDELKEVSRQLTIARQQCRPRDRALCYTLQYTGLDALFSCDNLTEDFKIRHLERMATENNFNNSIESSRKTFAKIPERVSLAAVPYVAEIKAILTRKRSNIHRAARSLDTLAASLTAEITTMQNRTLPMIENVAHYEIWRWLAVVGIAGVLSLAWGLLLCGAPCGCGATSRTIALLISALTILSFAVLLLWTLGVFALLAGVHGQSLLCRPLYNNTLYINSSTPALFNNSVQIQQVLRDCQRGKSAYSTFHLATHFDINPLTNPSSWPDLKAAISNLTAVGANMSVEILDPTLQLNLQVLSQVGGLNLGKYRGRLSGPVTRRDLVSFGEQLNTVARQLSDLESSKRFDGLAVMTRKVARNEMARLCDLRDRILYKITAMEVLFQPLGRQANQSLASLKGIQYFLDNQHWQVSESVARMFGDRVEKYLEELHGYVERKVGKEIGKCRPLWEVFNSMRFAVCKLVVDPLNGISVMSVLVIFILLGIAPVVVKLVEHYREVNEDVLTSISHRRTRDVAIIDDESTWVTPSSITPPEQTVDIQPSSSWASPPSLRRVPPTLRAKSPKRLSTIASRISAGRVPQIPSVSRARSPRRQESMRLIEPVRWKAG